MWGRPVDVPPAVAASLEETFGASVQQVRVVEHSLFVRLHGPAVATTRRRRIYLRGSAADFFANPWLMLHEYCHVLRQWEPRSLTVGGYLLECLRRGYWNNRFEIEAREYADANLFRLQSLLSRSGASAQQRLAVIEPTGDQHEHRAHDQRHPDG
jgi:hypothetical protein